MIAQKRDRPKGLDPRLWTSAGRTCIVAAPVADPYSLNMELAMRAAPRTIGLCICALFLAACAGDAADDETSEPADSPLAEYAGTWDLVAVMESGDTVPYTMTATDDEADWMVTLPGRDPMPLRILTVAEDSIVSEVGPYPSLLRDGVEVTVRSVSRLEDGRMVGTMEAHYAGAGEDAVVGGTVEGTRTN